MHLFQLSEDYPGELEFRYPWLPFWMVHNRELLDKVSKEVKEAIPKGLKVSELTELQMKMIDEKAIQVMCLELPYVENLRSLLDVLVGAVDVDPSKAPKHKVNGKRVAPPGPPKDPMGVPPGL